MTEIRLTRDESFGFGKIRISGHSGYSEEGSDIVCAYISSAADLLMCILIDKLCLQVETKIEAEKAIVSVKLPHSPVNDAACGTIRAIVCGFASQMEDFSKQFPNYVSITYAKG